MAEETKGDETIDLESLVKNMDKTPTDGILAKIGEVAAATTPGGAGATSGAASAAASSDVTPKPAAKPSEPDAPLHDEALPLDQLDNLLAQEDPEMAAQLEAMRKDGFEGGADAAAVIDADDEAAIQEEAKTTFGIWRQFLWLKIRSRLRIFAGYAKRTLTDSKGVLRELGIRMKLAAVQWLHNRKASIGHGFAWLKSRSLAQKLSLLMAIVALVGLSWIALKTVKGTLLPKTEKLWIASFSDHADGVFTYDMAGPHEDFNDPLLHPEFVVLIERVVVNLARTPEAPDGANPMAAFELYLQADNQDTAVEIKDRDVEIRDALGRSVERMTYPELAGEEGKTKLKLVIRKDLNEVLTKGKIRRVFFKTLVLNPES